MKNVLVTGAAGFLGSHLMLHHIKNGDKVLGIDNFSSSAIDSAHVNLIRGLNPGKSVLLNLDITDSSAVTSVTGNYSTFFDGKIDLIYNFACPASPPRYQAIPVETMLTCVVGTANMLDVARKFGSTLVHASTSEIYGDPEHSPQLETYRGNVNSYGPRACYDEGKRAAESLCYDYYNKYKVDARVVRIFNTYGPHMDPEDGRVVSNFICQTLKEEPITVYGHGQQTRSFCYVDDLIRAIVSMGSLPNNPGTPINIGNPNEFTIQELADLVHEVLNVKERKIIRMEMPKDDPTQRRPDITLANNILGWEPKVQLREGLLNTIEYFRKIV